MSRDQILAALTRYVADEILAGRDDGLDAQTPLLEWGVINSMEITRLLAFIHDELGVEIPGEQVLPQHLQNLAALTDLVVSLRA